MPKKKEFKFEAKEAPAIVVRESDDPKLQAELRKARI